MLRFGIGIGRLTRRTTLLSLLGAGSHTGRRGKSMFKFLIRRKRRVMRQREKRENKREGRERDNESTMVDER